MTASFAHLHLHSQYSLLDGAIRLKDLFPRLHEFGMTRVALTDHGTMFGALDFYKQAIEADIKPIIGCETYIARDMTDRGGGRDARHLILLARDLEGYRNLTYLMSRAYLDGFYYSPRIDKKLLRERRGGLIGMSACLSGEVPWTLLNKGYKAAVQVAREYADIFESGSFYLEIQPNGLPEQEEVNEGLVRMSKETGLGVVASNDCHYLDREDAQAHDILMCVQTGKTVDDKNRLHHEVDEFYLKSPEEMEAAFVHVPQALETAAAIAEQCNVELDLSHTFLPHYQVPEGHDLDSYLTRLAQDGMERRLEEARGGGLDLDREVYQARLDRELGVIKHMKFSGYFLIVWDFIRYAKEHGIPVGPGRGSGAGSLVAYSLRITDLDPLPYGLLFERFLNPDRVNMPDFDIDFCMNRRDEVIRYVTQKYGKDNVAQIATMHSLKAKGVVRDVARAMGLAYADGDRVSRLVPDPVQGKTVSLPEAVEQEPKLRELAESEPKIAELLRVAIRLEGLNRHAGMHAAGVVIGDKPIWEYTPCFRGANGEIVTQYAKTEVEDVGLVKFDFLGLKTLTILAEAEALIRKSDPSFRLGQIPLDDPETYEMIARGATTGVFQLESPPFREMLKHLKPDCFEDIIAAVALYRPGPLGGGMVEDFIDRKHGKKPVIYRHPWLEPILKETYGVIVYQEQVMQIASALGGFSLGQADILRRAMGKKKKDVMVQQRALFLEGADHKGVDPRVAGEVFDLMAHFAGYGFNKSHSACYAFITVQTAWLKRHWPVEYMAAVLTCEKENSENLVKYIAEARAMGIDVLRPDVNESDINFSVAEREGSKYIRFGLSAVRNVGEGAVESSLAAREEAPFTGLFDFCERVDARKVNRRVLEALIKSGAFDGVAAPRGLGRARLMASLEAAHERAQKAQRDRESGQTSLFGLLEAAAPEKSAVEEDAEKYQDMPEWEPRQLLAFEKENLGFYVSGHPLDRFEGDLHRHASARVQGLIRLRGRSEVRVGGLVTAYRERPLKNGKGRMAIFMLEDKTGSVETVCFSRAFSQYEEVLKQDEPVLVTATLEADGQGEDRKQKLQLKEVITLSELRKQKTTEVRLLLDAEKVSQETLARLKEVLLQHVGDCRTVVEVQIPKVSRVRLRLSERFSVTPGEALLVKLERLFGESQVELR